MRSWCVSLDVWQLEFTWIWYGKVTLAQWFYGSCWMANIMYKTWRSQRGRYMDVFTSIQHGEGGLYTTRQ
jgi:hypothetical protein